MPRQTRSAANSPTKRANTSAAVQLKYTAPISFVLPKNISLTPAARFISLRHPQDGQLRRYLFCPSSGLYEFTKLSVPTIDPRSILIAPAERSAPSGDSGDPKLNTYPKIYEGFTSSKADILVATPIDVIFHILPILHASLAKSKKENGKGLFLSADDLFDIEDGEMERHLSFVLRNELFRPRLESRLEAICDVVDAGDEKMFRLNDNKVLHELVSKAQRLVAQGLPTSMEEKFVTRALEVPMLSVKRQETDTSQIPKAGGIVAVTAEDPESLEPQASVVSSATPTTLSETSSVTTGDITTVDTTPKNVLELLRLKTAMSFIMASYVSTEIAATLEAKLAAKEAVVDFTPLEEHLNHVANLRAEAVASRSFGDFNRKRGSVEDEDAAEMRAEKKRKLEEEDKKKRANQSKGVRDLKKVDVSGMKKMSDFFSKKATPAKPKS